MLAPSAAATAAWHKSASAEEDRELCAIARDAIAEALHAGRATCTFRGHCIRVDCWPTLNGRIARCTIEGRFVGLADSLAL
jgi:hypothetical protein